MSQLPYNLWETSEELEDQILHEIQANHVGIQSAIKVPLLAKIVGCSQRKVRAAVSNLRDRGYPICASIGIPAGYFWPASKREFWEFIHRAFRPRWRSMKATEDAMIEGFARLKQGEPIELELQPELMTVDG